VGINLGKSIVREYQEHPETKPKHIITRNYPRDWMGNKVTLQLHYYICRRKVTKERTS